MSKTLFSERVNAVSNLITTMTPDPGERLGIASALMEIYRYELQKNLIAVPTPRPADVKEEVTNAAPIDQAAPAGSGDTGQPG